MMTATTFSRQNDADSRARAHYQGRDSADICCSALVKLIILTPEKGGFYAPDHRCYSLHLISTYDCTSLLINLRLCYESYFREDLCSYTFIMMVAS